VAACKLWGSESRAGFCQKVRVMFKLRGLIGWQQAAALASRYFCRQNQHVTLLFNLRSEQIGSSSGTACWDL